ncbi:MAG: acyl-ACP--UDP-N-acetylglucosamine O-acyltransferase [Planctomycetota bacterium]|jgi:UDP-N-acetylglucosamine acyltransferase|nr:acyl-ACP--UDP-N-acetylglucosamine O-acyltransferase [Planctomycetota bacterium]MDP6940426.1 acyl-ACP--UDP-N-acetylglucosamine O-acyltransferase [Planctomycetota bacterium]
MSTKIHPTSHIAPGAELDSGVVVGPFCHVGHKVEIGADTVLGPHVVIQGKTTIGQRNRFMGQASIGGLPQDLKYAGEDSALVLGDDNVVREFVTINIGTAAGSWVTTLGDRNLLMACAHIAHDCVLEDDIIVGNNVLMAGHVRVESQAIVSGGSALNHFVTVGTLAMVGGMARIIKDVPPYMVVEGSPGRVRGVNSVGLNRKKTSPESVAQMRDAYRRLYADETPTSLAIQEMETRGDWCPEVLRLIAFLRDMERGYQGRYRESLRRPPAEA